MPLAGAVLISKKYGNRIRLLLIGAGDTGEKIARDILSNSSDE